MTIQTFPANSSGHLLYRWTDSQGNAWACAAYDHGPFCRLCRLVEPGDEVLRSVLTSVEDGLAEVRTRPDGEFEFKLTDKGRAHVEALAQDG